MFAFLTSRMPAFRPAWFSCADLRAGAGTRIALFTAVYFCAVLPFACRYVTHHPDERHYTDAALLMLESGDYATPRTPTGNPRLVKPVLSYWLVAGGYKLVGVSPLAARVPFLLASCGVVALTYLLAGRLCRESPAPELAAILILIHPALWTSAPRSIPDMPLCLFMLLSAYGFAGALQEVHPRRRDLLAAYGGGALAVLTKGLPGVALVGFCTLWLVWMRRSEMRRLLIRCLPMATLCGMIAASWFAAMYWQYADRALSEFLGDQVSVRLNRSPATIALQLPAVAGLLAVSFLPWLPPVLIAREMRIAGPRIAFQAPGDPRWMLLSWIAVYLVLASMVNRVNLRYLLPVVPPAAILLAEPLTGLHPRLFAKWTRGLLIAALVVLVLIAAAACGTLVATGQWLATSLLAGATLLVVALGFRFARQQREDALRAARLIALVVPAWLLAAYCGLHVVALPDTGERLAEELQGRRGRVVVVGSQPSLASKLRVCGGGRLDVFWTRFPEDARYADTVVLAPTATDFSAARHATYTLQHGWRDIEPHAAAMALCRGRASDFLASHRQSFTIAALRQQPQIARGELAARQE